MDIENLSAYAIPNMIKKGEVKAEEVVGLFLERIRQTDDTINSFITINEDQALEKAREIDRKIENKEEIGSLAGIPISLKDNISTKDIKTSCGSKMLENYIAPFDASIVELIDGEDGIIIGKTNMDEFAIGGTTETSYYGPTKNPLDPTRVPGGSSGGSAASVRANQAMLSVGTDTGGSVRQPAAFCGLVGIKPSYGTISRYGLVTMASSLDQAGVLAKNVRDAGLLLKTLMKYDERDSSSYRQAGAIMDRLEPRLRDLSSFKIGYIKDFDGYDIDESVMKIYRESIEKIRGLGGQLEEIKIDSLKYAPACYHILATAEISSSLARYDGIIYGHRSGDYHDLTGLYRSSRAEALSDEVKRRIIFGSYVLTGENREKYYLKALKTRRIIRDEFKEIFRDYDLILSPSSPCLAFKLAESTEDTQAQYRSDIFTVAANLAGLGAISLPAGQVDGLEVGIQLSCDNYQDHKLIEAGLVFEGGNY